MAVTDPGESTQPLTTLHWDHSTELAPGPAPSADVPSDDDYFEEDLPGRPLRKRMGPITYALGGLALIAVAFFAGVTVEKHNVSSSSTSGTAAAAAAIARLRGGTGTGTGTAGRTGTTGAAGGTGATGAGGFTGTSGTITLIDGNNIYVTQADGSIVKVVTNPASTFSVTSNGTITNLHPGDNVTVVGPSDGAGTVTATSVSDGGTGAAGGARRFGGGGGTRTGATGGGAAGAGTGAATGTGAAAGGN